MLPPVRWRWWAPTPGAEVAVLPRVSTGGAAAIEAGSRAGSPWQVTHELADVPLPPSSLGDRAWPQPAAAATVAVMRRSGSRACTDCAPVADEDGVRSCSLPDRAGSGVDRPQAAPDSARAQGHLPSGQAYEGRFPRLRLIRNTAIAAARQGQQPTLPPARAPAATTSSSRRLRTTRRSASPRRAGRWCRCRSRRRRRGCGGSFRTEWWAASPSSGGQALYGRRVHAGVIEPDDVPGLVQRHAARRPPTCSLAWPQGGLPQAGEVAQVR